MEGRRRGGEGCVSCQVGRGSSNTCEGRARTHHLLTTHPPPLTHTSRSQSLVNVATAQGAGDVAVHRATGRASDGSVTEEGVVVLYPQSFRGRGVGAQGLHHSSGISHVARSLVMLSAHARDRSDALVSGYWEAMGSLVYPSGNGGKYVELHATHTLAPIVMPAAGMCVKSTDGIYARFDQARLQARDQRAATAAAAAAAVAAAAVAAAGAGVAAAPPAAPPATGSGGGDAAMEVEEEGGGEEGGDNLSVAMEDEVQSAGGAASGGGGGSVASRGRGGSKGGGGRGRKRPRSGSGGGSRRSGSGTSRESGGTSAGPAHRGQQSAPTVAEVGHMEIAVTTLLDATPALTAPDVGAALGSRAL